MLTPKQLYEATELLNQSEPTLHFKSGRPRIIHLEFKVIVRKEAGLACSSLQFLWPNPQHWVCKLTPESWTLTRVAKYVYASCVQNLSDTVEENGQATICFRLSAYDQNVFVGLRRTHSKDHAPKVAQP